jgi:hypothetical protein
MLKEGQLARMAKKNVLTQDWAINQLFGLAA